MKFDISEGNVFSRPGEVFETFVEIDEDFTIDKDK